MKKVKFLNTSAGAYGVAHSGDELVLKNGLAGELEKAGTVQVLGDADDDEPESVAQKGSLRIHDETIKEKVAEEKEDKYDPTNQAKNKEKNEKAGPNAPKKK